MASNNFFKSDLYKLHSIVQSGAILYPKELIIATIRDFFSRDSYYRYQTDKFGFPLTPDHTDLLLSSGFKEDGITTRLFIGESFRNDVQYLPAIIVKHNGSKSVPISFNREVSSVIYEDVIYEDGYGNSKRFPTPKHFVFAGAWEGSITVEVQSRDIRATDDLTDLLMILFTDLAHEDMKKAGLVVTGISSSSRSETGDRNDFIFRQSITLDVRSEWRREIKISNVIDAINFSIDFGTIHPDRTAPNLTIKTEINILDILNEL